MKVKSYKAGSVGEVELDVAPFGEKVLYRTLKDAVVMHMANQRQGTASTKGRSEVKGTNKKPYKQKHTGRARAGDVKSPIWRGGGTVFGPKPRDYSYHMPTKARRVALRTALAGKIADGELVIADLGDWAEPSSRSARKVLGDLDATRKACVVITERNENLYKSFRNFPRVEVRIAAELCAYDVVNGGTIIAEQGALDHLSARVGRPAEASNNGGES
ncbi:MAG: 50S ribosomal protein L4 [Planctomycetota bacterium]|jgi:large subunit ribosomal protein L4|nr:50S ribosomal protein L4 [bacterium]MDB4559313.1 50S ribosomal protein L4 [Planctomycetota bacterium]MDB4724620.1 50S ribosomal protein L4 [Planctomycetota bacterium]MDB4736154.1 50S ribosomal protein L4 [Planctomycetota bacterium]MDB4780231.1 50S ribosomal protein L4 [Planctomycetota bacterium]